MAASSPSAVGKTLNIGSGRETSIGNLVELIGKVAGRPVRIETDQKRERPPQSEIDRLVADSSLARTTIGWEPRVSLEDGLRSTMEFIRANLSRYRPAIYAR